MTITLTCVLASLLLKLLVGENTSFIVLHSEAFGRGFGMRRRRLLDKRLLLSLFAHVKSLELDDVTT